MNRNIVYSGVAGLISGVLSFCVLFFLSRLILDYTGETLKFYLSIFLTEFLFILFMAFIFWRSGIKHSRLYIWIIITALFYCLALFISAYVGILFWSESLTIILRSFLMILILSVGLFVTINKRVFSRQFLFIVILGSLLKITPVLVMWIPNIGDFFYDYTFTILYFLSFILWPVGLGLYIGSLLNRPSSITSNQ